MFKMLLIIVTTLGVGAAATLTAVVWPRSAEGTPYDTPEASAEALRVVAGQKVFFGHQSVGFNVLDGLPAVYGSAGVDAPAVVESGSVPPASTIHHIEIAENGYPLDKIAEFDQIMRDGMAEAVDIAVLKLCYADFRAGQADVDEVFSTYRDTMAALKRDFPGTAFVAVTSPLQVERGPRGKVKAFLGRPDKLGPEHNILREEFNALMRAEYSAPGELFDLAAVQSTDADGDRIAFERDGETYYSLNKDYAKDPGHLNAPGGEIAASAFLAVLAEAVG